MGAIRKRLRGRDRADMDEELVNRLAAGDRQALDQLFRESARDVYRLALKISRNRELAEDVTQDAFIRLWEVRSRLDAGRSVKGLLAKITANLCLDRLRRGRRENTSGVANESELDRRVDQAPIGSGPGNPVNRLAVDQALERLPSIYRAVLALRYGEDLSYQEIAEALRISVSAVALRIHRGKQLLRGSLQPGRQQGILS